MGADRHDDRDAGLLEQLAEIGRLRDVVPDDGFVGRLADSLGQRLHVVSRDASVVRKTLVDHDQLPRPLGKVVVVDARGSPPIGTK